MSGPLCCISSHRSSPQLLLRLLPAAPPRPSSYHAQLRPLNPSVTAALMSNPPWFFPLLLPQPGAASSIRAFDPGPGFQPTSTYVIARYEHSPCLSLDIDASVSLAIQAVPRWPQDPARSWAGANHQPSQSSTPAAGDPQHPGHHHDQGGTPSAGSGEDPASEASDSSYSRQCHSPQDHQREGVQVSMSQREPASRPASRHSSQSPVKDGASSPSSQRNSTYQDDSKVRPPHDPGGFPVAEGVGRGQQQLGTRTPGVRNILNSPGQRRLVAEASSSFQRHSVDEGAFQQAMGAARYRGGDGSPPRPFSQVSETPQTGNSHATTGSVPAGSNPSADRGSPSAASHPYPLGAARRMLTPKSPRAVSLSRAAMRTIEPQHLASLPPHAPRGGAPAHDGSPLGGPPGLAGPPHFHGPGTPSPYPPRPSSSLSRSLSNPTVSHGLPPTSPHEPLPAVSLGRELGGRTAYASGSPFATPLMSSRGPPGSGMMGEGRWGPGILGSLPPGVSGSRNLQITEGHQHLLTITPAHGEEILVPVDVHQASKQADEKRQRNAGASARFRQRKKEKEKEQQQGLQKLESRNRDLEKRNEELEHRNQELEQERDHYRNDRNRLREIVSRTPGINHKSSSSPTQFLRRSINVGATGEAKKDRS
ncbi:hypothetical protein B0H63DRAFT_526414 [Podospora didyma]|uniref:BZIP domain-containing protein n=1 Tax=Podospora didyma TaxID=330526 RepID=A0AAE0KEA3_9PEZI|nr:hypothetical protein B0H63DRAFT_526414 [Podospora didyma]